LSVDCTCGDDGNNFYFSLLRVYDVIAMSHVLQLFTSDFYPTADGGAEYCGERVCLCVCVCLFAIVFSNYASDLQFLCMLPMAMARPSSGGIVI